jgi:hypothetical protein
VVRSWTGPAKHPLVEAVFSVDALYGDTDPISEFLFQLRDPVPGSLHSCLTEIEPVIEEHAIPLDDIVAVDAKLFSTVETYYSVLWTGTPSHRMRHRDDPAILIVLEKSGEWCHALVVKLRRVFYASMKPKCSNAS